MPTITCGGAPRDEDSTPPAPHVPTPAPAPSRAGADSQGHDAPESLELRVQENLRREIGQEKFDRWFRDQVKVRLVGGRVDVAAPNPFVERFARRNFASALRRAAAQGLGARDEAEVRVDFRVDQQTFEDQPAPPKPRHRRANTKPPEPARHAPRWRHALESFVVGESNRLAYAAAAEAADPETRERSVPLFIHGPCGVGKTHLLQAIANRYAAHRPGAQVKYLTAEVFTNDFIKAVKKKNLEEFRRAYRSLHLLCLDDVHFLASKEGTQSELQHTFDAIGLQRNRVVIASDQHPSSLSPMAPALLSRFVAGNVVRIDPPDRPLRERLIRHLAAVEGLTVEDEAVRLIAAGDPGRPMSAREIEGIVIRLAAYRRHAIGRAGGRLGIAAARWALDLDRPLTADHSPRPIKADRVIREVCAVLTVDIQDLRGKGRHKRVVLARSLTVLLAREMTAMSYPELARAMNRPNHSTLITAYNRIRGQIARGVTVDFGPGALEGLRIGDLADRIRCMIARSAQRG